MVEGESALLLLAILSRGGLDELSQVEVGARLTESESSLAASSSSAFIYIPILRSGTRHFLCPHHHIFPSPEDVSFFFW